MPMNPAVARDHQRMSSLGGPCIRAPQATGFVGREDELAEVWRVMAEHPLPDLDRAEVPWARPGSATVRSMRLSSTASLWSPLASRGRQVRARRDTEEGQSLKHPCPELNRIARTFAGRLPRIVVGELAYSVRLASH
jgi:hypothetical protein